MLRLELCPCCGDYAFLMNDTASILNRFDLPTWYVQCYNCGLRTTKGEKEEVVTKWNRRVSNETIYSDDETQMD